MRQSFASWRMNPSALLALPALLWLCLFLGLPMLIVAGVSLTDPVTGIPPFTPLFERDAAGNISLAADMERYLTVFTDGYYIASVLSSLNIAATATGICLLLGYPMAYALSRCTPGAQILLVLLVFFLLP